MIEASCIVHGDGLAWLREHPAPLDASVITSLPDVSELSALGFEGWRAWFIASASAVLQWLPPTGLAIFYQSDILYEGRWIDKAHLILTAADAENAALVWHKVVCRLPPGTESWGRASYSHMLCLTRGPIPALRSASPDVLPGAGKKSWTRGMGSAACEAACNYLRKHSDTRLIVDPFCGRGSVLGVASKMGFDVLGVEISAKRCRKARTLIGCESE